MDDGETYRGKKVLFKPPERLHVYKPRHLIYQSSDLYFFPPSPPATLVASSIVLAITLRTFPSSILRSPAIVHPAGVDTCSLIIAGCWPARIIRPVPCIAVPSQPAASSLRSKDLLCAAITTASFLGTPIITPPSAMASTIMA
jgi:hypothetical protein